MKVSQFVEYIIGDQLTQLSGLSARSMFGGFGIYLEGMIVGIVVGDVLYLKVDESNRAEYEAMGSTPFTYKRKDGRSTSISYWSVPNEVVEDSGHLTALVLSSYEINLAREVTRNNIKNI
jgi:DNA transformation protein